VRYFWPASGSTAAGVTGVRAGPERDDADVRSRAQTGVGAGTLEDGLLDGGEDSGVQAELHALLRAVEVSGGDERHHLLLVVLGTALVGTPTERISGLVRPR
jgi:hypothetical protein